MKQTITDIICGLLILLFVYTAASKLLGFAEFRAQLGSSPFLGAYAAWIVWAVPVVELIIAVMLTVSATRLYGMYASAALLTGFTLYIGLMLLTQQRLPCSCGGVIQRLGWKEHIVFNLFFLALSVWAITITRKQEIFSIQNIARIKREEAENLLIE